MKYGLPVASEYGKPIPLEYGASLIPLTLIDYVDFRTESKPTTAASVPDDVPSS